MDFSDQIVLTEEEIVILTFSIFAAHPMLFWEDNMIWNSMWCECQKVLIECKLEYMR